ncbi:hypothetical protein Hgul01_02117 [Herpetosiphon gulosus]|uniref:ParB/Sulfiredoxin domain-containing protein n=2 Tax=Herpetosiphon gulosus TaxID=1973496 RepID=A0ABP9WZ20_9CHLR
MNLYLVPLADIEASVEAELMPARLAELAAIPNLTLEVIAALPNPIVLDRRPHDKLEIMNGRHRIYYARQANLVAVPAQCLWLPTDDLRLPDYPRYQPPTEIEPASEQVAPMMSAPTIPINQPSAAEPDAATSHGLPVRPSIPRHWLIGGLVGTGLLILVIWWLQQGRYPSSAQARAMLDEYHLVRKGIVQVEDFSIVEAVGLERFGTEYYLVTFEADFVYQQATGVGFLDYGNEVGDVEHVEGEIYFEQTSDGWKGKTGSINRTDY